MATKKTDTPEELAGLNLSALDQFFTKVLNEYKAFDDARQVVRSLRQLEEQAFVLRKDLAEAQKEYDAVVPALKAEREAEEAALKKTKVSAKDMVDKAVADSNELFDKVRAEIVKAHVAAEEARDKVRVEHDGIVAQLAEAQAQLVEAQAELAKVEAAKAKLLKALEA